MIDHVSVAVRSLQTSSAFYQQVLKPLGMARLVEREITVGFGKRYPEFWLNCRPDMTVVQVGTGNHICLRAPTREAVTTFYTTAISLGGLGDGEPRDREAGAATYFGAFIRDLDGNKIEAVSFPRTEAA